jgi:hypothetical protein
MRRQTFIVAAAAVIAALSSAPAGAQNAPRPKPPAAQPAPPQQPTAPPQTAEVNVPYKPVGVSPPVPVSDPGVDALRKQIAEAAGKRDRAALARLIVTKGFFWDRGGGDDDANKKKSGIDNLAIVLGLTNKEGPGWDMLAGYAEDPTASPSPVRPGAVCAPADPLFNGKEMEALLEASQSDIGEWGFPLIDGLAVRDRADANAPVREKLGMHFVRVAPETNAPGAIGQFIRIVTPAGKYGYVAIDDIAPLGNDQLCYVKDGGAWKIGGYLGAGDAQ